MAVDAEARWLLHAFLVHEVPTHDHVHRVGLEPIFHPVVAGSIRVRRRADHARHTLLRGPAAREHSLIAAVTVPVAELFLSDSRIS